MALTLKTLISQLSAAKPQTPVFTQPSRESGSSMEVEAAFNELNAAFKFNRSETGLIVNEAMQLSDDETRFLNATISSFNNRLLTADISIDRTVNGTITPAVIERIAESQGITPADFNLPESAVAQTASAGCSWQWWFNIYWWGFKLSFNSCAVNWLAAGGKAVDNALTAFHLPAVASPIVKLAALLLKPFDKGNGSTIYFTWIGAFWIAAK